jgi:hypothetical protein
MNHDRSHVFSCTVQRRRKIVPSSFVRSCDVLAFAGGIASGNFAFQLPNLAIVTRVPGYWLYAWETLLSRKVDIVAPMSSTANRYTKIDGMVRVVVFLRYAASGASAIQPFDFRLHLLAVLSGCVNIHAYDFNFEELCMLIILSKTLGI